MTCVGTLITWPYTAGGRSRRGSPKAGTNVITEIVPVVSLTIELEKNNNYCKPDVAQSLSLMYDDVGKVALCLICGTMLPSLGLGLQLEAGVSKYVGLHCTPEVTSRGNSTIIR